MQYITKNKYGETVTVDEATREALLQSGKRKQQDFSIAPRSLDVPAPRVDSTQQESTRVASKDKSTRPTTLSNVGNALKNGSKNLLPTATDPNKTTGQRVVGAVSDIASYPLRTVAGIGAGLGELAGGSGIADALHAANETVRNPTKAVEESGTPYQGVQRIAAAIAEDPTTLPSLLMPLANVGLVRQLATVTAGHALDRYARRGDASTPIDYAKDAVLDVALPTALHGISGVAAKLRPYVGEHGKETARNMLMRSMKAAPMAKSSQEWEGLKDGLHGMVDGKPVMEQIIKSKYTPRVDEVVENYNKLKDVIDERFEPVLEKLQKTGATTDIPAAMRAASKSVVDDMASGRTSISFDDLAKAKKWTNERVSVPDNAELAAKANQVHDGLTPTVPRSGPNKGVPTYKFADGTRQSVADFNDELAANLKEHDPKVSHAKKSEAWHEAFKGDPEHQTARQAFTKALGRDLREQLTSDVGPRTRGLKAYDDYYAKKAAGIIKESSDGLSFTEKPKASWTADDKKKYNDALKAVGNARNAARTMYKEQLANAEPLYQMEDAMWRAGHTGANRDTKLLSNITRWHRSPGAARAVWDIANSPTLSRSINAADVVSKLVNDARPGLGDQSIRDAVLTPMLRAWQSERAMRSSDRKRYTATPTTQTTVSDTAKGR